MQDSIVNIEQFSPSKFFNDDYFLSDSPSIRSRSKRNEQENISNQQLEESSTEPDPEEVSTQFQANESVPTKVVHSQAQQRSIEESDSETIQIHQEEEKDQALQFTSKAPRVPPNNSNCSMKRNTAELANINQKKQKTYGPTSFEYLWNIGEQASDQEGYTTNANSPVFYNGNIDLNQVFSAIRSKMDQISSSLFDKIVARLMTKKHEEYDIPEIIASIDVDYAAEGLTTYIFADNVDELSDSAGELSLDDVPKKQPIPQKEPRKKASNNQNSDNDVVYIKEGKTDVVFTKRVLNLVSSSE